MRSHLYTLIPRMIRAGLRVKLRYKVIAAGIDHRDRIISIATNSPYLPLRGRHAEERVMFNSPRSLRRILIMRVGARGQMLKIDPCALCAELARKRNVKIEVI
jgi:hypothetical protein